MLRKLKKLLSFTKEPSTHREGYLHVVSSLNIDKTIITFVLEFETRELLEEMILSLLKLDHSKKMHLQAVPSEEENKNEVVVSVHFYEQDLIQVCDIIESIVEIESEIKKHGKNN